VARWGLTEPCCQRCRDEMDDLSERCVLGALEVDRAVRRYRETLAA
jgi:hypothetical protein